MKKAGIALLLSLMNFFIAAAASENGRQSAELLFVGDVMQHQAQLDKAKAAGNNARYDYTDYFALIAPEIKAADYAVCNLEVPLGGGPDYSGYPNFSAPDSYAEAVRDAGFDMFLTANNHTLDRHAKAAARTLAALDRMGVDHVGTYSDKNEREQLVPFIKDINGIKIGFLNYTYGTNGIEPDNGFEVSLIDKDKIAEEIGKTRDAGAEIIVVAMHWGLEYVMRENEHQRDLADFLIDNGVDLVIGSHPHVVQPMEVRYNEKEGKNVLVVFSLGNLISNMSAAETTGGALVRARVERDADGIARFKKADYDTFGVAKPEGSLKNFQVVPSWMSEKIPSSQRNKWRIFDKASSEIFDTYNIGVERRHKKQ